MSQKRLQRKKFSLSQAERKKTGKVLYIIGLVIMFIAILLLFSLNWMFAKFGHVSIDSTLYTMTAPMTGTDSSYVWSFIYMSLLPSVLVELVIIAITNNFYKKNIVLNVRTKKEMLRIRIFPLVPLRKIMIFLSVIMLVSSCIYVSNASGLTTYIQNKTTETSLYDDYYVDPATAQLTFPQKKQNLIYLYAESLEKTLESKEEGGGKDSNIIPNLTELQKKYISVANQNGAQAHVMKGGDWTMAGMVSQSSGIPLMINVNLYNYNENASYLPGAYSLGQILGANGYKNVFVTGCDSKFAATDLYYKQHGDYEIIDPSAARKMGYIPEDYNVFWGYEDTTMFEILKKEVTKNYESGQPFNIAAATLDTHADDVYVCDKCDSKYSDIHDKVYHCTDEQIADFVKWFEKQPCYENTTLIISGDHCSFATTYFDDCKNYDRTVFSMFVNAKVEKKDYVRTYATFDMLPSTLAAMGINIEGNRLGLGTNIFSDEQTLCEKIGIDQLNQMLSQNSTYYTDHILQGSENDILNISRMQEDDIEINNADEMYENYYVSPDDVNLTFPEKKQNLLYLYVESLEKTFETKDNDGVETKEIIPYLTQLQNDYVKVENEIGNQGYVCYGGDYTIKAMVTQSSGIPLTDDVNAYYYDKDYKFIPGGKNLGDILYNNGYKNIFISGFDSKFAATDMFFTQHGNYQIIDWQGAKDLGYISQSYSEGWGYNDKVTFDIIKDQITKSYESGQPFSITAATMDTHADDIYVCDECSSEFKDEHEKVYNCIDNRIKEFLEWFKQQPSYNDTTIVITGDHLSYASDYFKKFDENYDRTVYSVFINAKIDTYTRYMKAYSTLDMFPTTLAAMGVKIDGDRLGLGVNLFSEVQPLLAKFGYHKFNTLLAEDCQYFNTNIMKRDTYSGKIDTEGIEYAEEHALLPQKVKKTTSSNTGAETKENKDIVPKYENTEHVTQSAESVTLAPETVTETQEEQVTKDEHVPVEDQVIEKKTETATEQKNTQAQKETQTQKVTQAATAAPTAATTAAAASKK